MKLTKNLSAALLEHIVNIIVLFLSYRLIIGALGVEQFGLWSFVLSVLSITSIGNAGFAGSAIKFISKYKALNNNEMLKKVTETSILIIVIIAGVFLVILYLFLVYYSSGSLSKTEAISLNIIMPWVLVSIFFASIGRLFLSILDGLLLVDLRSYVGIFSRVIYLIIILIWLPKMGIQGLAIAYFSQVFISLVLSIILVKRNLRAVNFFRPRFDKEVFNKIFLYGLNFQASAIFQMFIDPFVKFILKEIGGFIQVGFYEIVYKVFLQARQLIVSLVNTMVPVVASVKEKAKSDLEKLYISMSKATIIFSVIILTGVFACLKYLLPFFKVEMNLDILIYSLLFFFGLFFNMLSVPSYIFNLGNGNVKLNMFYSLILAFSNVVLVFLFKEFISSIGVILGWTSAHIVASVFLIKRFNVMENFDYKKLYDKSDLFLIFAALFCVLLIFFIDIYTLKNAVEFDYFINIILLVIVLFVPILNNKYIKNILKFKDITSV